MIVFRPNVQSYMPGVDIVNRPVVAAAAASGWWLAGGTIDAAEVEQYGEDVSTGVVYTGTHIFDPDPWTMAVTFTTSGDESSTALLFRSDSAAYVGADVLTPNSVGGGAVVRLRNGTSNSNPSDDTGQGTHSVIVTMNGTSSSLYVDGVLVGTDNATAGDLDTDAGEWFQAGDELICVRYAAYNIAFDSTQAAAWHSAATA